MYLENFDTLIYGEDGQSPIRPTIVRILEQVKKENVRLRIDVRSQAQGTTNSRNEHTLYADPADNADPDGLMRILVERLNDSPGEGFIGQIRINFGQAGASGERYGSWQRTIRSPSMGAPQRLPPPDEDEDGDGDDDNSSESFHAPSRSRGSRYAMDDGGGTGMPMGVLLKDETVRVWLDSMMNHNFRMLAQQQTMFDRALRMMESYTMRFGFPTSEPGIIEARGGEPAPSAAPGSPGPNNYGILPMLIQNVLKIASGQGAPAPTPAPAPAAPAITQRDNSRALAIRGSGQMVQRLRPVPRPRPPAPGYDPAPPVHDHHEDRQRPSARWQEDREQMGPDEEGADEYTEDGIDETGDEGEDEDEYSQDEEQEHLPVRRERAPAMPQHGGGGMPDLNGLTPEQMKAAVIAWIRADPSRKGDVMAMLPDLSNELG